MSAPVSTREIHARRRAADRRLHPRTLAAALLLSVVLHVAALFLIRFTGPGAERTAPPPPRLVRIVPAMQAFDIDVVAVEVPAIELQVQRQLERPIELPSAPAPAAPDVAPVTTAPRPDPGDPSLNRLRYRNDPQQNVWRRPELPAPSADDLVRERIASRIDAYNDSIAAEAAARARATDWTVKDGEGGRWGVSPGAIHLGTVTLPLPFAFAPPPGRREEIAGRMTTWTEIQQQATIIEGRDIVKDRVKAMEQRKAAERAARQGGATTGSGSGGTTGRGGSNPGG